MKLIQRLGYYLGGFAIGLIILTFFLNGKKTSCSYGPEARVLKNISIKTLVLSPDIILDSLAIQHVLKTGNIDFSKSDSRQKPCGIYNIEGIYNTKPITLTVKNCDSTATILNAKMK